MLRVDELYLKKAFNEIHTEYAKQAMNIMKQHPGRGSIKTDIEFDLQAYKEIFTILYVGKMTRKEIIKDLLVARYIESTSDAKSTSTNSIIESPSPSIIESPSPSLPQPPPSTPPPPCNFTGM